LPATDWVLTIGKTGEPIALEDNVPVELGREAADRRIRATMEHHWPDTGRHHAEITVRGRDLEVKDLDSKYGTFVYSDDRLPGEELQRLPRGGTAVVVLPITLRLAHSCYVRVRPR
jgi:pSer/pThr/pTyr-binding forkhead associated (FHA) protein